MELPARKQNRLPDYDYSTANAYFITICTNDRVNLFWENPQAIISQPEDIQYTQYGSIVSRSIIEIPDRYPMISLDKYVVMPNHVHLLLQIQTDEKGRSVTAPTISTVVRMMKGAASRESGFPLWQKSFYDHVVRSDRDYRDIWNYIDDNPMKWSEDKLYR